MIKKLTIYYLLSLVILTLLMGIGGYWIINSFYPDQELHWSPSIPCYFFIVELLLYALFYYSLKYNSSKKLLLYMAGKMMKLMFSIVFLIIYAIFVAVDIKEFLITFGVFYLIYMIFDTIFFYKEAKKVS